MADTKKPTMPPDLVALASQSEAAKAEYLADRGNAAKARKAHDLMDQLATGRQNWRAAEEAAGTRTVGAHVENNTEG